MKTTIRTLTALGIGATGFGGWGRYSASGRACFDEMAGVIPLVSFYLGLAMLLLAAALWGARAARR